MKCMKRFLALAFALVTLLGLAACKQNNPAEPEQSPPQLSLNVSTLALNDDRLDTILVVANRGGGALDWSIASKPAWLTLNKTSGSVQAKADTINIAANTDLENGEYSGEIALASNGGSTKVQTKLMVRHGINIFPGVGAGDIDLGDTYAKVRERHGAPDRIDKALVTGPQGVFWLHLVVYKSSGLTFVYATNSITLDANAPTQLIDIETPHRCKTPKLIALGSTLVELKAAYGEPSAIDRRYRFYEYSALGIDFGYDANETKVVEMIVYSAQGAAALGVSRAEIRRHLRELE